MLSKTFIRCFVSAPEGQDTVLGTYVCPQKCARKQHVKYCHAPESGNKRQKEVVDTLKYKMEGKVPQGRGGNLTVFQTSRCNEFMALSVCDPEVICHEQAITTADIETGAIGECNLK